MTTIRIDAQALQESCRGNGDLPRSADVSSNRAEVAAGSGKLDRLVSIAEQTVVAHTLEAARQDVQEKASEKVLGFELQDLLLAAVGVVAPAQTHDATIEFEQAVVGQRDTMGVAGEVVEDASRPSKGFLAYTTHSW